MSEIIIDNQQKYENYKEQFKRLNRSLSNGFYLEAMFIAYAIIEDRTESILRHGELWEAYLKKRKGKDPTLNSKITYIQGQVNGNNKLLHRYFSDDLLEQILQWKEDRNRLIHALLQQSLAHNEVRAIAERGDALVKKLRTQCGKYNRAVDLQKEKLPPTPSPRYQKNICGER